MLRPQQSPPLLPQFTTWRVVSCGESDGSTLLPLTTHYMTSCGKSCVNSYHPNIVHQKNMTFVGLRSARARQSSCRCPTENDVPAPFTGISSPPAASTSSLRWHFSRTSQILKSLLTRNGSRLSLEIRKKTMVAIIK